MHYHETEFKEFYISFNPVALVGTWQHAILPQVYGTFEVIECPVCDGFYQWELCNPVSYTDIPPAEVVSVLVSWRIYVPFEFN